MRCKCDGRQSTIHDNFKIAEFEKLKVIFIDRYNAIYRKVAQLHFDLSSNPSHRPIVVVPLNAPRGHQQYVSAGLTELQIVRGNQPIIQKLIHNLRSMDSEQNITYRNYKPQRASSLSDLSRNDHSPLFDTTMISLPDTSFNESQTVIELKEKINELTNQLTCAHQEIEILNTENFRLKTDLNKSLKLVETYKNFSISDNIHMSPSSIRRSKGNKSTLYKDISCLQKSPKNTSHQTTQTDGSPKNTGSNKISPYKTVQNHNKSHEELGVEKVDVTIEKATLSPSSLIDYSQKPKKESTSILQKKSKSTTTMDNPQPKELIQMTDTSDCNICIISTNIKNKVRDIAETTLRKHSKNICHYLMPHCKTEQLLRDLETKLKTFTYNDFCIILIGEEDFSTTNDYFQLVFSIRTTLEKTKHTNVIVCTPTYRYSYYKTMYNWRVENFNNLLYLDILTHEHAYFLDSNKNLSDDYTMFKKRTGLINNYGIHTIFIDIDDYIQGLKKCDLLSNNTNDESHQIDDVSNNQLFL